jgi:hypothetical protein
MFVNDSDHVKNRITAKDLLVALKKNLIKKLKNLNLNLDKEFYKKKIL